MNDELAAPEGYYWGVSTIDFDGVTLKVVLYFDGGSGNNLEWTWEMTPRILAKQERIEARIRACKRALLRKYAEMQRVEAAIHASR